MTYSLLTKVWGRQGGGLFWVTVPGPPFIGALTLETRLFLSIVSFHAMGQNL